MSPLSVLAVIMVAFGCICSTGTASGGQDEVGKVVAGSSVAQNDFAGMSVQTLVQKLLETNNCSLAFYELWRREHRDKDLGYESFVDSHYDPEVVVCPQEEPAPPIYVVLYGFLSRETFSSEDKYEITNAFELFPPSDGRRDTRSWDHPAFEAFTSAGKSIQPFGGGNCLEKTGLMADINGDGFVERADHTAYRVDDITSVNVLEISVVKPEPQPLLSVLYDWGEDEWAYQFVDASKNGILQVELGPKIPGGIKPKVVFKWDKDKKAYSGPAGEKGDHYRRLDVAEKNIFKVLEQFKKAKLTFPKDADFVDEHNTQGEPWARQGRDKPSPRDVSRPYHYVSLKGLSNEAVVRYMGDGKSMSDLESQNIIKTHIPADFWTLDPKSAALVIVDDNRYPDHRKRFRLAVDDKDGQRPPDVSSLAFTYISDESYIAIDRHFFVRVDPKKSYLAYASSWAGGIVGYNFVHDQPTFDFRYCGLTYDEARHLVHAIWWLNRVRSCARASSDRMGWMASSADGRGSLVLRDDTGKTSRSGVLKVA